MALRAACSLEASDRSAMASAWARSQLVVEEGALAELTPAGRGRMPSAGCGGSACQNEGHHGPAAQHVFASEAVGGLNSRAMP